MYFKADNSIAAYSSYGLPCSIVETHRMCTKKLLQAEKKNGSSCLLPLTTDYMFHMTPIGLPCGGVCLIWAAGPLSQWTRRNVEN